MIWGLEWLTVLVVMDNVKKLWVYGCSFSTNFQDLLHLPPIELEEGWPFMLADKLNLKLVDRSQPGFGWNDINLKLQEDIIKNNISKNDLIILSPSYFQRLTFPELASNTLNFDNGVGNGDWVGLTAKYGKPQHEVVEINIKRFYYTLTSLRQLGYKIFGWCWTPDQHKRFQDPVNPYILKLQDYLIPSPNGTLFWEDWILHHPECMLIPGKPLPDGGWTGDTHFGKIGHKVTANQFFTFISNIY